MNKYRFRISDIDTYINIPIEIKWDFDGRDDSIDLYEKDVIQEVIGKPIDYEISRYSHKPYDNGNRTDITYEFNFFNNTPTGTNIGTATIADWKPSYLNEGFNANQVYYYEKPFTKSFFKLDFYDTNDTANQIIYFTIIIPVQQGGTEDAIISPILPKVKIKIPVFNLDFMGDKEGFFIYWLRNLETLNISTFFMSAKFFSASSGGFIRMINAPQSTLSNRFNFDGRKYFYYKVELDYNNWTYSIYNNSNTRVGTTSPIKWYEYVNQPKV